MSNQYSALFINTLEARGISKNDLRTALTSCWARTDLQRQGHSPSSQQIHDHVQANGRMFDEFFIMVQGFGVVLNASSQEFANYTSHQYSHQVVWKDGTAKVVEFVDQSGNGNASVKINVGKFIGEQDFTIENVMDIVYAVISEELSTHAGVRQAVLSRESFQLFQKHKGTNMGKVFQNIELNLIDDK